MKILNSEQIRNADAHTIKNEPIASIDLMERAAGKCAKWIKLHFDKNVPIYIFCGVGNNGGDGLAISRLLQAEAYTVTTYLVKFADKLSQDCQSNLDRLETRVHVIDKEEQIKDISIEDHALVIDAIFGSGLSREVEGLADAMIQKLNQAKAFRLSIDIPSGLFSEDNAENKGIIFQAHHTLCFETPKLAFLLPEKGNYVGDFSLLDIGLDKNFLLKQDSDYFFMNEAMLAPMLRPRLRFSHKGNYGHALLVAGSKGKMGAAALAAQACLRTGAGLLSIESVKTGVSILQNLVAEAMVRVNEGQELIEGNIDTTGFSALGIGPGMGTDEATAASMKLTIQNSRQPMVIDADGLNILAENKTWMAFLPKNTVLTPHPGEFERLAGPWSNDLEMLDMQKELSRKFGIYIVLKGAYTRISCPDGRVFFNSTGNPGMATAGSGDTLTGVILGFLAQGYSAEEASLLGVFLHGLAGDHAAEAFGYESLVASDIIGHLPEAFQRLRP